MRDDFKHLLIRRDGAVVTITMNRPEVLNAFNDLMLHELTEAVEEAARDETVRSVVITGSGRAFGAGQDLASLAAAENSKEPVQLSEHLTKYHRLLASIRTAPKPVIASIRGVAAGISCNIALGCDLRVAADNARFIQAFARIGLVPDGGGGYFLPRLVGLGRAMEIAMLADEISGTEAERIGLVNKCVPQDELEAATATLAHRLAQGPTGTYALIKDLMYTSLDSDLQTSLKLEGELQNIAMKTADHKEGVAAFLQKRPPQFKGS